MLLVQDMDYVSPSPHKIYVDGWCDHDRILSLLNPYNQMILGIRTQGERLLEARLMILYGYPVPEMIDPRHGFRRSGVPKGPLQFRDYGFELLNSLKPYESGSPRYFTKEGMQVDSST